ncbi:MAG: methionyl-tRNA formyltransferase [Gammaproteobacteria bacterium]|nr:methionyl-tRNA formyltransferase [Gammaproteobacteria bacterium]
MAKPRIIFAGTPEFAASCLSKLLDNKFDVVAVYTQPDRKAGRGKKLQPSAVKQVALAHGIPVEQPLNFKSDESLGQLKSYQCDLMIVVAYGLLLPETVLSTPKLGCINVHASLLPRWRGAAPIQRAIEAGDEKTGVAIMQMDVGLDTGPVWETREFTINEQETGASLHDRLAELGANSLVETLPTIFEQKGQPQPQPEEGVVYAHKLQKAEAEIDWKLPAAVIERKIRAFNSWPVAYFTVQQNNVRVWDVELVDSSPTQFQPGEVVESSKEGIIIACGENALKLKELQAPGSRRMPVQDLLNSRAHWFEKGAILE